MYNDVIIAFNEKTRKILEKDYGIPEIITKLYFEETKFLSFSSDENGNIFLHYDISSLLYSILAYYLPSNNDVEKENLEYLRELYDKITTGQLPKQELIDYAKQQLKGIRTKIKSIGTIDYQHFLVEGYDKISFYLFNDVAEEINKSKIFEKTNFRYASNLEKIGSPRAALISFSDI